MLHPLRSAVLALLLLGPAHAQTAGYRDFDFANPTGSGSATIATRVYYPSPGSGPGAPIAARAGGHPVVVFVHGLGRVGDDYALLGDHLASAGFVVALPNTGQGQVGTARRDAAALFTILGLVHGTPGHELEGALDMTRAGLAGHSMGGRSTVQILAANPGFRAGLAFAPFDPGPATTGAVDVPFGLVHGSGDNVARWRNESQPLYVNTTNFTGLKFLYVFGDEADHDNVVGLGIGTSTASQEIWARAARVMTGFFLRYLEDERDGLAEVVGLDARAEPRLKNLFAQVESPDMWLAGDAVPGQTVRVELMAEETPCGVMRAASTAAIPTPYGLLELSPATLATPLRGLPDIDRLAWWDVTVPATMSAGDVIFLQGFGRSIRGDYRLIELTPVTIR